MTSGINPPSPNETPGNTGTGDVGGDLSIAADAPIKTLGDLKKVLLQADPEKGEKLYNSFITAIVLTMLGPMRTAQANAEQAAKKMSQDQS